MAEPRADLLVELGCEELPPKALAGLAQAFFDNTCKGLEAAGIAFERDGSRCLYTPRRMSLLLRAVAARQPDRSLERRGPALSAAFDAQGKPTAAALGFARSVGKAVEDLERLETDAGAWLRCTLEQPGQALAEVLFPLLQSALDGLPVPRPMRWSDHDFAFVRPVHWLVVLHGDTVPAGSLYGCRAGRETRGHRIHAPGPLAIAQPGKYLETLRAAFVEADPALRRARIAKAVHAAAGQSGGSARMTEALLDEVNQLVEWPVAVACRFETEFLEVPQEALVASMEDHQKFFPVLHENGSLSGHFVAVANLESQDVAQVRAGFERVVRPRLADARFFWNQDRRTPLADRLAALEGVVFQEKLGSVADKSRRIATLSRKIAELTGADPALAERAALLSKCDLVSLMVGEFPELQGTMGADYALASGEPPEVAAAIGSHYQPRFSGDTLPADAPGRAVGIADRMDTLAGIFATGQRPSGNRDPFALRRAALGVIRMLVETPGADLSLGELVRLAADGLAAQLPVDQETRQALLDFMLERLRQSLRDQGHSARQVQAVMAAPGDRPADIGRRLDAVRDFIGTPQGASLVAANKRIGNILKKSEETNLSAFRSDICKIAAEKTLFDAVKSADAIFDPALAAADYPAALAALAALSAPVDAYFEAVMVMDDDPAQRRNRLAQLAALKALFDRVADLSLAD